MSESVSSNDVSSKRYRVLRRLGEGAMGEVYEALDTERDERIALKVLKRTGTESLVRFKREFRALSDLHHPNLVGLGELVSEEDQWFFTMELVRGVDFVSWVRAPTPASIEDSTMSSTLVQKLAAEARGPFDDARLRSGIVQVARALAALHETQQVHRDVKPSNVLVTPEGRVVVLDFGLVTDETEALGHTTEVAVVGTPAYMAPEQAASKPATSASDWYSVGVLLYEALTGKLPFRGAPLEILLAKQRTEPPPPSELEPKVPPDLDALCMALLRFDPATRAGANQIFRVLEPSAALLSRPAVGLTHSATFVGREPELRLLRAALADVRTRKAVTVLVHGESGIGKSVLVRHFTDELHLREHGAVVFSGRCFERENVPYKAFDGVVDAMSRYLARLPQSEALALLPARPASLAQLFPVLRRVEAIAQSPQVGQDVLDPRELRTRAFAALRDVLTRMADRRAIIVTIDDLQWADGDSVALLADVLQTPDPPSILLVGTIREGSGETTRAARGALELAQKLPGDVRHVKLGPLSHDDSLALATSLIERTAPGMKASVETIATEAAGHPQFIDEIVRHLFHAGANEGASLRLDEALWSRVEALDERARKVVEILAVAGGPVSQDAMILALEVAPSDLARLVSFLRVAHLVQTSGSRGSDTIEPYHSRVRAAVLAHLDSPKVRAHHRRLAIALESSGSADEEAMAAHWEGAGVRENAANHMLRAAVHASEALAFDRAAKLYERALLLRSGGALRVDREADRAIERKWADALAMAGRGAQAAKAYRAAAMGATAAEALDLKRRAAEQLLHCGHFEEGLTQVQQVLESVGLSYPKSPVYAVIAIVLFRAYLFFRGYSFRERDASDVSPRDLTRIEVCWSVSFSLAMLDPIRAQYFQNLQLALALRAGEIDRVARALGSEIAFIGFRGTRSQRQSDAVAARATTLAVKSGNPHIVAWIKGMIGAAHYLGGRFEQSLECVRLSVQTFRMESAGAAWEISTVRLFGLQSLAHLGRMRELCAEQPLALREADDRGDLHASVSLRIGYPNLVWLVAGHPDMARLQCKEAMRQWSTKGFHLEHYYALLALTSIDLYEGHASAALERMNAGWVEIERSLLTRVQSVKLMMMLLRARATLAAAAEIEDAHAAKREELLRAVERDVHRIERERAPWTAPPLALLRAGVAASRGEGSRTRAFLEEAVREAEAHKMELLATVARAVLGARAGGDAGRDAVMIAETWMRQQTIQKPARFVAMLAPGIMPAPTMSARRS